MERYIITKAILTADKQLIPLWDENIKYHEADEEDFDDYDYIRTNDSCEKHSDLLDCVFDIVTKKLSQIGRAHV
jgi:hypothetical protein